MYIIDCEHVHTQEMQMTDFLCMLEVLGTHVQCSTVHQYSHLATLSDSANGK